VNPQPTRLPLVQHSAGIWSAEYPLDWPAGLLRIPVRMTVIRLDDGRLIVHSPGPISRELGDELDALGPVAFIVVPQQHGKFTRPTSQRYPAAQLLAAASAPRGQTSVSFHSSLTDEPPAAWTGQVETHLVRGFRLGEVVLFHRPSRTLVITDLCFNIQESPSRAARAFCRANGMWRHFGPSRLIRLLAVSDRDAFQRSLDRILQWEFERIIPGHGDVIERGGPAALRAAWPQ
jgi:hypothetical protein